MRRGSGRSPARTRADRRRPTCEERGAMRKRRDWIAVGVVAALLAAAVVLAGTVAPGATGKAVALGTSPSPWPSPSAGVVLQVGQNGTFVKEYTLADLEALDAGSLHGYAGFMNTRQHRLRSRGGDAASRSPTSSRTRSARRWRRPRRSTSSAPTATRRPTRTTSSSTVTSFTQMYNATTKKAGVDCRASPGRSPRCSSTAIPGGNGHAGRRRPAASRGRRRHKRECR